MVYSVTQNIQIRPFISDRDSTESDSAISESGNEAGTTRCFSKPEFMKV